MMKLRYIVCLAAALTARADRLDGLLKRSPFEADKSVLETAAKVVAPAGVEFGGYMIADGRPLVSLSETGTGRSYWVAIKDPQAPLYVENLDTDGPTVTVRVAGRTLTLGLRKTTEPASNNAPGTATSPATGATILNPGAAPDPVKAGTAGDPAASAPNRIPPTKLRIPPRVDDPPVNAAK